VFIRLIFYSVEQDETHQLHPFNYTLDLFRARRMP
jgi:hypothetical protein